MLSGCRSVASALRVRHVHVRVVFDADEYGRHRYGWNVPSIVETCCWIRGAWLILGVHPRCACARAASEVGEETSGASSKVKLPQHSPHKGRGRATTQSTAAGGDEVKTPLSYTCHYLCPSRLSRASDGLRSPRLRVFRTVLYCHAPARNRPIIGLEHPLRPRTHTSSSSWTGLDWTV